MNTFKKEEKKKKKAAKAKGSRFRKAMLGVLGGTFLAKDNVLRHVPFMLFMVLIAIGYISYGYHAESTVKRMYELENEVKDLKSQDLTLKTGLEKLKQQSRVALSIKKMGLHESVEQPYKIKTNTIEKRKED